MLLSPRKTKRRTRHRVQTVGSLTWFAYHDATGSLVSPNSHPLEEKVILRRIKQVFTLRMRHFRSLFKITAISHSIPIRNSNVKECAKVRSR